MINSGLSMLRSLYILAEQTESKPLAAVVNQVRLDVERGSSLSAALAKHPKAFNRLYVAMVRAGEAGGVLDSVLQRLATTIEKQVELRRKVKSAMTYPAVVSFLVLLLVTAMLLFVIPMFQNIYGQLGGKLPVPTQILIDVSNVVRNLWFVVFGGRDRRGVRVPPVDQLRRGPQALGHDQAEDAGVRRPRRRRPRSPASAARSRRWCARVCRFSSRSTSCARPSGNWVVSEAVRDTQQQVKRGEPLSKRLEEHDVFPPMVVQMMAVGEETGALDEMLDKIADFYDQEVEATVNALTSLIEPILIVIMGVVIGGMIISLYLPMFDVINLIK